MRKSGIVFVSLMASLLATSAMAQGMGGGMGGSSSAAAKASGAAGGSTMGGNMAANPFSKEDMIMMIVERDRATAGMTEEQKKEARAKEMAEHGSETPAQRLERKHAYEVGWSKLSAAEKDAYTAKYEAQQRQRAAAAAGAAGGATPNAGAMGGGMGGR